MGNYYITLVTEVFSHNPNPSGQNARDENIPRITKKARLGDPITVQRGEIIAALLVGLIVGSVFGLVIAARILLNRG